MVNLRNPAFSINCNGKLIAFYETVIMGILNVTPNSFYDGGMHLDASLAVEHAAKMLSQGAHIIDVGGASTQPNAIPVGIQEEMDRVLPVIEKLNGCFPNILISIDTYQSQVAKAAYKAGAAIVNDISGGNFDEEMFAFVAKEKIPYVLSHIQGNPQTMQQNPQYEDVVLEVLHTLSFKIAHLEKLGAVDILVDPGFGFGKTVAHNYQLLHSLGLFNKALGKPVMVGLSRKSMLYKPLGIAPKDCLNATTAAHMIALQNGAQILRVHDVKEAKEAVKVWEVYCNF